MEKTKYRCPYISDTSKLCSMSAPCCSCVQFSPDYLEKILTATNSVSSKSPTWEEFQTWCFNRDDGRDARSLFHFFTGNYPA